MVIVVCHDRARDAGPKTAKPAPSEPVYVGMASPRGFAGDISAFASKIEVPLEAWQRAA